MYCIDMILTLLNDQRLGASLQEAMNDEDTLEVRDDFTAKG
jgi:hypothetical protein